MAGEGARVDSGGMRYLIAVLLVSGLVFVPAVSATSCAGADPCPWTHFDSFGNVGPDEFRAPLGVSADAAGNVYVVDADLHRVEKLDPSGSVVKTWGSLGDGDGEFNSPYDIAVDPVGGGVYVADSDNDRVEKFDTSGQFISAWGWGVSDGSPTYQVCTSGCRRGIGGSGTSQFDWATGIATDGANVYVADERNKRVQKYDLAGASAGAWTVPGGQRPERVTVHGGKVYVTTTANTVWRFSAAGVPDTSWDGDGVMGSSGSGPGQFDTAQAIAVDATGVYVADALNHRIQKLDSSGSPVASWGSFGSDDGQLDQPWGILATGGSVWVSEWGNDRLQKFSPAGVHQDTVGSPMGAGDYYWPNDVTWTPSGAIYVADGTHDIQRLDASGNPVARWVLGDYADAIAVTASGVYATRSTDRVTRYDETGTLLGQFGASGSGLGQFHAPSGIAADVDGNLYVADTNNNRVQKLSPAGAPLAVFGSAGPGAGHMYSPHDVALDSAGNVYVADSSNGRIDKFSPAGDFVTMWGTPGSADGQLDWPNALVIDRDGHVFVSDTGNDRIQEFDSKGNFIRRWGVHGSGPGELFDPAGLTIASDGAIWVADGGNHRIVRFCCPAAQGGPPIGGSGSGHPGPGGGSGQPTPGGGNGGADTTAPQIALSGRTSQRARKVRRRGLALRLATSERASVTLRAVVSKRSARRLGLRGRAVGRATASLAGPGTRALRLRLSARARRALPRLRTVRIVVRAAAADTAGNRSGAMRAISVRR